jgi:hypothetical protein
VAPVTHVRSTLLTSSLVALRQRGLYDAYFAHISPELQPDILAMIAGSWVPISLGLAHYRAANALGLSAAEQFEIGHHVAERIQNSVLGTLARLAKGAGATPWTGLENFQRLWDRLLRGGAGAVYRLGPKEARIEIHGNALVEIDYCRNGWRGMFAASAALFARKVYVNEEASVATPTSMGMRVSWV